MGSDDFRRFGQWVFLLTLSLVLWPLHVYVVTVVLIVISLKLVWAHTGSGASGPMLAVAFPFVLLLGACWLLASVGVDLPYLSIFFVSSLLLAVTLALVAFLGGGGSGRKPPRPPGIRDYI